MVIETCKCKKARIRKFILGKIRLFILWAVMKYGPVHGYGLISIFKKNGLHIAKASRIYPIMAEAEKKGYLASKDVKHGGRKVKKYRITKKGKDLINKEKRKVPRIIQEFAKEVLTG